MLFHFKDDRDLCLSNQESEELKELVHEFQYQSQQGKHYKGEHFIVLKINGIETKNIAFKLKN